MPNTTVPGVIPLASEPSLPKSTHPSNPQSALKRAVDLWGEATTASDRSDFERNLDTWKRAADADGFGKYDPREFYTAASNNRGFGERTTFRIPPEIHARVAELIETKAFPAYKSSADFIRDAIHHHLITRVDQLGDREMKERLDQVTHEVAFAGAVQSLNERVERWRQIYEQTIATLTDLYRAQGWEEMALVIRHTEDMASGNVAEPLRASLLAIVAAWKTKIPVEYRIN